MPAPARQPRPHHHPERDRAKIPRIIALSFDSHLRAAEALASARRLEEQELLEVLDAVFVTRHADGSVEITESIDPTPAAAAVPASLFGALVGTLIAGPLGLLIGGALAGSGGALVAKLIESGISHRVVGELQELTRPGQTVLALMVSDIAGMAPGIAVIEELRRFRGARVVYAQLPAPALDLVQRALDRGR